jgi:hypothetical protein
MTYEVMIDRNSTREEVERQAPYLQALIQKIIQKQATTLMTKDTLDMVFHPDAEKVRCNSSFIRRPAIAFSSPNVEIKQEPLEVFPQPSSSPKKEPKPQGKIKKALRKALASFVRRVSSKT